MPSRKFPLYEWLEGRIFPRSFLSKVFLVVFPATQVPLISVVIYLIAQHGPSDPRRVLKTVLLATLCNTVIVLWALNQLLRPMELARSTLAQFIEDGKLSGLPIHYRDEIGILLQTIDYALRSFDFQKRALERLAAEDHLTALPNRRATEEHLTNWMQELPGTGPLAIGLIDIDNFKAINDRFGHAAGDNCLTIIAGYISRTLRQGDWISRWGGDEFLLIVRVNPEEAADVFERLCQGIALCEIKHEGQVIRLSVSIGYSMAVLGETWAELVERADDALYQAKRDGRSQAFVSPPPQHAENHSVA